MSKLVIRLEVEDSFYRAMEKAADKNMWSVEDEVRWRLEHGVVHPTHRVKCLKCGTLFRAGRGTGRRFDSKYCSDQCLRDYHSLARST